MKMVANVMVDWRKMDGDTDEIKKLNSLLTSALVGSRDIPADECLEHAKVVMGFWLTGEPNWALQSEKYLKTMFAVGHTQSGETVNLPETTKLVMATVERAKALLNSGRWPDRLVAV